MKKIIFLPLLVTVAFGVSTSNAVAIHALEEKVVPNLTEWLNVYDYNYERETQMNFKPDSYKELQEIQNKLSFPFTQHRKTIFVENGLYMYDLSDHVNAGYFSIKEGEGDQLYRYTLPEGTNPAYAHIDDVTVPEGFEAVKQTGYAVDCDEFFVNMHKFRQVGYADKFTYDETKESFVSSDADVLKDFLAFTASCYLNPEVGGDEEGNNKHPYLGFGEARISKGLNDNNLTFRLYVTSEEDKAKLETTDGLFATAIVSKANEMKINVLDAYLETLQ